MELTGQFITMLRRPEGLVFILPLAWILAYAGYRIYARIMKGRVVGDVEKAVVASIFTAVFMTAIYAFIYIFPAAPLR